MTKHLGSFSTSRDKERPGSTRDSADGRQVEKPDA
jgi:hypothetical protein